MIPASNEPGNTAIGLSSPSFSVIIPRVRVNYHPMFHIIFSPGQIP